MSKPPLALSLKMKGFIGFVMAMCLVQIALGIWQWNRRAEKNLFLDSLARAAQGPASTDLKTASLWQKVTITGRFLHEKSSYVRSSRPEPKPGERDSQGRKLASGSFGVLVMTPFLTRLCDGQGACTLTTLYVNRGFVPTPPDGRIPTFDRPEEMVTLTGFIRPSEKPGFFQPGNRPAEGIYFTRNIEEMAKASGLFGAEAKTSPYDRFLDQESAADETVPPFGISVQDFLKAVPNNHFEYAITWWSLAAVNAIFLAIFLASRRRRTNEMP